VPTVPKLERSAPLACGSPRDPKTKGDQGR